jgi:endonuclease/exonuclease/phosphatase family metal-dependent hydrolase
MSPRRDSSTRFVFDLLTLLGKLPPKVLFALLLVTIAAGAVVFFATQRAHKPSPAQTPGPPGSYLFCSWNVENFYDDEDDPKIDDKMEDWFGRHPEEFRTKVEHLAAALLLMNDGRGPDIMSLYEVESERCLQALRDALNERLGKDGKGVLKYEHILFVPDRTGRHFAPGIITRLNVEADRTHKFAKHPNGRTLEGHITANGCDLVVLAAHWTSRVEHNGKSGEEHANAARRMSYARDCYGRFRAILTDNPEADVILCGDFNDEFTDASIQQGLHAAAIIDEARNALAEPHPLALFANWPASADPPGTIYGRGRWSIFDHICVSRGMLDDKGWSWIEGSATIFAAGQMRVSGRHGEPFRFGDAKSKEHGYSDHFPVTVRFAVKGNDR